MWPWAILNNELFRMAGTSYPPKLFHTLKESETLIPQDLFSPPHLLKTYYMKTVRQTYKITNAYLPSPNLLCLQLMILSIASNYFSAWKNFLFTDVFSFPSTWVRFSLTSIFIPSRPFYIPSQTQVSTVCLIITFKNIEVSSFVKKKTEGKWNWGRGEFGRSWEEWEIERRIYFQ